MNSKVGSPTKPKYVVSHTLAASAFDTWQNLNRTRPQQVCRALSLQTQKSQVRGSSILWLQTQKSEREGIGVRTSIYIQALLAAITASLKIAEDLVVGRLRKSEGDGGTTMDPSPEEPPSPQNVDRSLAMTKYTPTAVIWEDIFDIIYPNLLLGCALIVSSVVQARTFGLTIYHGLIILNLSWVIIFSTAPALVISENDQRLFDVKDRLKNPNRSWRLMSAWLILHLTMTAAFGLWFFGTIASFDRTTAECKPLTLYYALGKRIHADDPGFRRFWLVIYSFTALPIINFCFLVLVFIIAGVLSCVVVTIPALLITVILACCSQCFSCISMESLIFKADVLGNALPALAVLGPWVLLVAVTEKAIVINTVGPDERLWTFGQTLAMMIALAPAWNAAKLATASFLHIRNMMRVSTLDLLVLII